MENLEEIRIDKKGMDVFHERILKGERLSEEGHFSIAERLFQDILKDDPNNCRVCNDLACVLWQTKRRREAVSYLKKAIELDPDYVDAVWNYGQVLNAMDRGDEAQSLYWEYLRRHPEDEDVAKELRLWGAYEESAPNR
jgi:tetratricopeptide (TPR) repeat protein